MSCSRTRTVRILELMDMVMQIPMNGAALSADRVTDSEIHVAVLLLGSTLVNLQE